MNLPPIPDDFITSRSVRYTAIPESSPRIFRATRVQPNGWSMLCEDWNVRTSWAECLGERCLAERKASGGLIGRQVWFTPETIPKGTPNAVISGIAFYKREYYQRFADDPYLGDTFVCSALASDQIYLERVSEGRVYVFCVPDRYVRFVGIDSDEVAHLRAAWLAERETESPQPIVARTRVRESFRSHVSPYDLRVVELSEGEEVGISECYTAPYLHPGTTRSCTKHFDVLRSNGQVLRCVEGDFLCVNMGWSSPDLPYEGPSILDETLVRF